MAKEKEQTMYLVDSIFELGVLKNLVEDIQEHDISTSRHTDILLQLIKALDEKIIYYTERYNLEVPESDVFYVEDYDKFIMRKAGLDVKGSLEEEETSEE